MRIIISVLFLLQALNISAHEPSYPTDAYPEITITVWTDINCGLKKAGGRVDLRDNSHHTDDAGENTMISMVAQSYWLSRNLVNDERLDWSTCADPRGQCENVGNIKGNCTQFLLRTSPDSNGNALFKHICYPLKPGAQVSHLCYRRSSCGMYLSLYI